MVWEPMISNPLKGSVVWPVPENKEAVITLFKDQRSNEFEDKDWTFSIEDVSCFFISYSDYVLTFLVFMFK